MKFDRTKFIGKFTQEANEVVQNINEALVQLEKTPKQPDLLKKILRIVHTLKGSANILHFQQIGHLAHAIEDVLIAVQDEKIALTPAVIDLLFSSNDLLSQCVQAVLLEQEERIDIQPICDALAAAAEARDRLNFGETAANLPQAEAREREQPPAAASVSPVEDTIRVSVEKLDRAVRLIGEIALGHKKSAHALKQLKDVQRAARTHSKALHHLFQQPQIAESAPDAAANALKQSLALLKGIEQAVRAHSDDFAFRDMSIAELYQELLRMRMLPLSVIFDAFPRAVRDMSRAFQKQIDFRVVGDDTALDKKIIEQLDGPLIHILRNSADHGIETPEERRACGKPERGLITIQASQESGHVRIEITDDGRGVRLEKLTRRAIQRGLISEEAANAMSDAERLNLIFLPRLSTSDMITDISGRGVGMDIVKAAIEQLKGMIAFSSVPGKGASCVLTVPVTLTTLRSLIIAVRDMRFAVPIDAIEETLAVAAADCLDVTGHPAISLRNQLIYLVDLGEALECAAPPAPREQYFVLIARAQGNRVGLVVDAVVDEQELVVKPLPAHIRAAANMIAGAAISSQNDILLILHIPKALERFRQIKQAAALSLVNRPNSDAPRILVVEDSANTSEIEKHILEAHGYRVEIARDGVEALERAMRTTFDAVITDVEMPRMDGFTLTTRLRELPAYADAPIVLMTSLERERDKTRSAQVGANAYITKGNFEQSRLIETIESLL